MFVIIFCSLDLLILKEIVLRMAGVELMEQITPDQIEAMSGGDHLKTEVRYINFLNFICI